METNGFAEFIRNNRGKIIGVLIGLAVALLFLEYGVFKTLFVVACAGIGYFFGARKENRDAFLTMVDSLFNRKDS